MYTQPTPRFTLPDPNRAPMTFLPPELLAHILHCAQEGQSLSQQQDTRFVFEKVCKAWYECDIKWRVVAVKSLAQVDSLMKAFAAVSEASKLSAAGWGGSEAEGEDVALDVGAIHVDLSREGATLKGVRVAKLLSLVTNAHTVELALGSNGLSVHGDGALGAFVPGALAKLAQIKHFTVTGPNMPADYPPSTRHRRIAAQPITSTVLMMIIPEWTKLESLALVNCSLFSDSNVSGIFSPCTAFKSLDLTGSAGAWLVDELPSTARTLKLGLSNIKNAKQGEQLHSTAKKLFSLEVADDVRPGPRARRFRTAPPRGQIDDFLAALDNVATLAISPSAISDFSILARLKSFTQLRLLMPSTRHGLPSVDPVELVALFKNSPSLKRATMPSKLYTDSSWPRDPSVESAARGKIKLVLT